MYTNTKQLTDMEMGNSIYIKQKEKKHSYQHNKNVKHFFLSFSFSLFTYFLAAPYRVVVRTSFPVQEKTKALDSESEKSQPLITREVLKKVKYLLKRT